MEIRYPFGEAVAETVTYAAAVTLEVNNSLHITTIALTGAITINVTPASDLPVGSMLYLKLSSDGTGRDATMGTGFEGPTIAGTASKTKMASFVFDGTNFVACAAIIQLN